MTMLAETVDAVIGIDTHRDMAWVTASGEADEQVMIEMTPQTWLTVDYSKQG